MRKRGEASGFVSQEKRGCAGSRRLQTTREKRMGVRKGEENSFTRRSLLGRALLKVSESKIKSKRTVVAKIAKGEE